MTVICAPESSRFSVWRSISDYIRRKRAPLRGDWSHAAASAARRLGPNGDKLGVWMPAPIEGPVRDHRLQTYTLVEGRTFTRSNCRPTNIMRPFEARLAAQKDPVKLGPVIGALSMISRYVQLQPNVAGLGININNMIDDIVERAEKKARGDLP